MSNYRVTFYTQRPKDEKLRPNMLLESPPQGSQVHGGQDLEVSANGDLIIRRGGVGGPAEAAYAKNAWITAIREKEPPTE